MKTTNRVSKMRIWGKEYDTYVGKDGKVHIIKPLPSPIEEWASLGPFSFRPEERLSMTVVRPEGEL